MIMHINVAQHLYGGTSITRTLLIAYGQRDGHLNAACRVGHNHIYGVCMFFLAGKSPSIRSYMVYIYGSGQH